MKDQPAFRELDKSLKIQKIVDTAAELFHKKGYRSTTLDDIAKELGVTQAALYHYVPSKEKLLSLIYIQVLENSLQGINAIWHKDLAPDEKLRLILQNHIKGIIIQSLSMMSVFFSEENQLPELDFRKIQEEKRKYNDIIEKVLEEGMAQGLFRKADPKLHAQGIIGMCNWIYKWYKPGHTAYSPDEIAEHLGALLEKGYLMGNEELEPRYFQIKENSKEIKRKDANQIFFKLKEQCKGLLGLLEDLEKLV